MRHAFLTHAAAAAIALTWIAGPSTAAQLSQISYTVQYGTFGAGCLAVNSITGGTVVYTPPGGFVVTPTIVPGGTLVISMYGYAGTFTMRVSPPNFLMASITPSAFYAIASGNPVYGHSGGCTLRNLTFGGVRYPSLTPPKGVILRGTTAHGIYFVNGGAIGAEVRTGLFTVPGLASPLGLGLLVLGFVVGGTAASRALSARRG